MLVERHQNQIEHHRLSEWNEEIPLDIQRWSFTFRVFDMDHEDCALSTADTQDDLERENRLLEVTNSDEILLFSSQSIPSRQSIGTSTTDHCESTTSMSQKLKPWKYFGSQADNSDTLLFCTCLLVLLTLPLLFGQILSRIFRRG